MSPIASILLTLLINHMGKFYLFFHYQSFNYENKNKHYGNKNKHNTKKPQRQKLEISLPSLYSLPVSQMRTLGLQFQRMPVFHHFLCISYVCACNYIRVYANMYNRHYPVTRYLLPPRTLYHFTFLATGQNEQAALKSHNDVEVDLSTFSQIQQGREITMLHLHFPEPTSECTYFKAFWGLLSPSVNSLYVFRPTDLMSYVCR